MVRVLNERIAQEMLIKLPSMNAASGYEVSSLHKVQCIFLKAVSVCLRGNIHGRDDDPILSGGNAAGI